MSGNKDWYMFDPIIVTYELAEDAPPSGCIYAGQIVQYSGIYDGTGLSLPNSNSLNIEPIKKFDIFCSARCYACNKFFKIDSPAYYQILTCPHCGEKSD